MTPYPYPQPTRPPQRPTRQPRLALKLEPVREEPDEDESEELSIEERFERFHADNPHVYENLKLLALQLKRREGKRKVGMKMLFEVLRYEYRLQTRGDKFKLNNDYTSRYARLMMKQEPELANFFYTRELRS